MISLSEIRLWHRIDATEEDILLARLEERAVAMAEKYTGHYFGVPKAVTEILHGTGTGVLVISDAALPVDAAHTPPIVAATVAEWDGTAWGTVLAVADYTVDGSMVYKTDGYWTFGRRNWRVVYWTGFDAGEESQDVKQAVLNLIGHWYQNREAIGGTQFTSELPYQVTDLLKPHRKVKV